MNPPGHVSSPWNWSRAKTLIGVSYDTDLRSASDVIERAALGLADEEPWVEHIQEGPDMKGVETLGDDAVMLRIDTRIDPDQRRPFERALSQRLKEALDTADIEMPFRQMDVWMRNEAEAA